MSFPLWFLVNRRWSSSTTPMFPSQMETCVFFWVFHHHFMQTELNEMLITLQMLKKYAEIKIPSPWSQKVTFCRKHVPSTGKTKYYLMPFMYGTFWLNSFALVDSQPALPRSPIVGLGLILVHEHGDDFIRGNMKSIAKGISPKHFYRHRAQYIIALNVTVPLKGQEKRCHSQFVEFCQVKVVVHSMLFVGLYWLCFRHSLGWTSPLSNHKSGWEKFVQIISLHVCYETEIVMEVPWHACTWQMNVTNLCIKICSMTAREKCEQQ